MISTNLKIFLALAGVAAGVYCIYKFKRKIPKAVTLPHEKFDGTLYFDDVVANIRNMDLKKDSEYVFVGKFSNPMLSKFIAKPDFTEGYETVIVGIMNVADDTIDTKRSHIVSAKSLDEKFVKIFGNQTIVKLV